MVTKLSHHHWEV